MSQRHFMELLAKRFAVGLAVSVGLDATDPAILPPRFPISAEGIVEFHRRVIDATKDRAAAFKMQSAGFEALGPEGIEALIDTAAAARDLAPEVPIILDAKRGDIANTMAMYAQYAFHTVGADAVTVTPYMGQETMTPLLEQDDKGIIVLCRTSNPGAGHYQALQVDGLPLYQYVARDVATNWNSHGNCSVVVGATAPHELAEVRSLIGEMPILVPGVGAQGGSITEAMNAGANSSKSGLIIHASRSLTGAWKHHEGNEIQAIGDAMTKMVNEIDAARS